MQNDFEFDVYISYDVPYRLPAVLIATRLIDTGLRPWIDSWALQPNRDWENWPAALRSSRVLVVLIGPEGIRSRGQKEELRIARSERAVRIIPVLMPGMLREELTVGLRRHLPIFELGPRIKTSFLFPFLDQIIGGPPSDPSPFLYHSGMIAYASRDVGERGLRLYKEPDKQSRILKYLRPGTPLFAIGKYLQWLDTRDEQGVRGFVDLRYATIELPAEDKTVSTSRPSSVKPLAPSSIPPEPEFNPVAEDYDELTEEPIEEIQIFNQDQEMVDEAEEEIRNENNGEGQEIWDEGELEKQRVERIIEKMMDEEETRKMKARRRGEGGGDLGELLEIEKELEEEEENEEEEEEEESDGELDKWLGRDLNVYSMINSIRTIRIHWSTDETVAT